jgi:hypothetical protein
MNYARLIVANQFGTVLDELQPDIDFASWRLNNIGQCKFTIAVNAPKATETNLRYGNRVVVEFENDLPDWGGVINTPRLWKDGKITITAYSGEYLFKYRTTDKGRYFTNQTIGQIYTALINEANTIFPTGVVTGSVYGAGTLHSPDYHFKSLLDIFRKSLTGRMSTFDFDVTPVIAAGKITFKANLYSSRGSDKSSLALIEGTNLAPAKLNEQGPIVNSWDLAGEGTGWGDERLTHNEQDVDSIGKYGFRESSRVYGDVSDPATLQQHGATHISNTKNPFNIFTLSALDVKPTKFAAYEHGDVVSLLAPSVGFGGTETTVRILAREISPQENECALVVQEQL